MTEFLTKKLKKRISADMDNNVIEKYARGSTDFKTSKIKYKGLRLTMQQEQIRVLKAAQSTAITEVLLPSDKGYIQLPSHNHSNNSNDSNSDVNQDMNQVNMNQVDSYQGNQQIYRLKQNEIRQHVDLNTAKNQFDLQLHDFGPYNINYSRNGRHLLFGGRKGHIAMFDCQTMNLGMEIQLQEEVHDIHFLHNESMFAVAQKEYTYIYDSHGAEIHSLRNCNKPYRLDFLPYHLLLVSIGQHGIIRWQDITTGQQVGGYTTSLGSCNVMKHNQQNSVSHVGHRNGVVTLWCPSTSKSLISMFCHKSPVTDLAIDRQGTYMATAGYDGSLKIWDLRTYRTVHTYKLDGPALSLDISDTGLLSMAIGRRIQILKDPYKKPSDLTYLKHEIRTPNKALSSGGGITAVTKALKSSVTINCVRFRPLEDILGIGHSHGITTIIVPGAGEANYDAYEANPFQTLKQRREQEVQSLLHKLSPDMIGLDTSLIGSIGKDQKLLQQEHQELFQHANVNSKLPKKKNKMRGKSKIAAKLRRRQKNVIDEQVIKLKQKQKSEREVKESKGNSLSKSIITTKSSTLNSSQSKDYDPLRRFEKKI